jgi:hypothetical protein
MTTNTIATGRRATERLTADGPVSTSPGGIVHADSERMTKSASFQFSPAAKGAHAGDDTGPRGGSGPRGQTIGPVAPVAVARPSQGGMARRPPSRAPAGAGTTSRFGTLRGRVAWLGTLIVTAVELASAVKSAPTNRQSGLAQAWLDRLAGPERPRPA